MTTQPTSTTACENCGALNCAAVSGPVQCDCRWCASTGISRRGGYEHYCDCPAGLSLMQEEQGPFDADLELRFDPSDDEDTV